MRNKIVEYVAEKSKIIYIGRVIDNNDYQGLGRIRVFPEHENIQQILESYKDKNVLNFNGTDILDKFKFTNDDPFVYIPLIPFQINIVPEVGELVLLMYSNVELNSGRKEQFYIPGPKSSPFNLSKEDYFESLSQTALGRNIKGSPDIKTQIGEDRNKKTKGIFAEVGRIDKSNDIAYYGKGSTDLILKPNEVLLRAGKVSESIPNTEPSSNEKRGFYQISYFNKDIINQPPQNIQISQTDDSPLSKLIEYDIIEGLDNTSDSYTGFIYVYDIPASSSVKNNEFKIDTVINQTVTSPIFTYQFIGIPSTGVTFLVNSVIDGLNKGVIDIKSPYSPKSTTINGVRFPFYYRPSKNILNRLSEISTAQNILSKTNLIKIIPNIKFSKSLNPSSLLSLNGAGLVSQFNKFGTSKKNTTINTQTYDTVIKKNSVSVAGSNKIILLSHDSIIPGKEKVNLNSDTIYGLSQSDIYDNLVPNTEPLVRGEKLKEFLNLIVKFLISHSHPFHQLPPTPITYEGTSVTDIEIELQTFDSKVLNQNIRIN